jgi:hypothetical protein
MRNRGEERPICFKPEKIGVIPRKSDKRPKACDSSLQPCKKPNKNTDYCSVLNYQGCCNVLLNINMIKKQQIFEASKKPDIYRILLIKF